MLPIAETPRAYPSSYIRPSSRIEAIVRHIKPGIRWRPGSHGGSIKTERALVSSSRRSESNSLECLAGCTSLAIPREERGSRPLGPEDGSDFYRVIQKTATRVGRIGHRVSCELPDRIPINSRQTRSVGYPWCFATRFYCVKALTKEKKLPFRLFPLRFDRRRAFPSSPTDRAPSSLFRRG